jgi:hypothetical protein
MAFPGRDPGVEGRVQVEEVLMRRPAPPVLSAHRALALAVALGLTLVLNGPPARAAEPATPDATRAEAAAEVERAGRSLGTLRTLLRETARPLDVGEVVLAGGRDPERLAKWVETEVAFEPYAGFLKGARGALVSGRANAADKALLLAELLRAAGHPASLVRGKLPADRPLPAAAAGAADGPPPDDAGLERVSRATGIDFPRLKGILLVAETARQRFLEDLWTRTERDIEAVAAALDAAGIPAPPAGAGSSSDEHWWVRTGRLDLDPTLGGPAPKGGTVLEIAKIPADRFHAVAVREKISKDGKKAVTVLETKFRTADLFGRTLTVANLPIDLSKKVDAIKDPTVEAILDAMASTRQFAARADVDGEALPGKGFDLAGDEVATGGDARVASAKKIGGAMGGLFGGLTGGDEEEGKKKPEAELAAAWLEVEISVPGERAPVRIRRDIVTPGTPTRQKVLDLLAPRQILVLPEELTGDVATRQILDMAGDSLAWLSERAAESRPQGRFASISRRPGLDPTLLAFGLGRRSELRRLAAARFGGTAWSHSRTTVVSSVTRFIDGKPPKAASIIDILENRLAPPAGVKAEGWSGNPALAAGALDTALEHVVNRRPGVHVNASVLLAKAILEGRSAVAVAKALPKDLPLGPLARAAIGEGLKEAAFVVVPGEPAAWYRVDLATGSALGYVEDGGGQEAAEYAEKAEILVQLIEMINFYANLGRCMGTVLSAPLRGESNPHEDLEKCFEAFCGMIPWSAARVAEVEASWLNVIFCATVSYEWEHFCAAIWHKVAPGGGGGGHD